ncbi:hypothetical protein ACFQU7_30440 [Pseudoroseomonas wenyumeiae]
MSGADALVVRGTARALPPGARPVSPSALRPLPGAPAGLLGVVALEGRLLPAWCWEPAPAAWVLLEGGLVGGSALCPARRGHRHWPCRKCPHRPPRRRVRPRPGRPAPSPCRRPRRCCCGWATPRSWCR